MAIQQLGPRQCFDLREADPTIVLLDVRTPEEFAEGHPAGAYNVPAFFREAGGLVPNPELLEVARRLAPPERRLILSCASGRRSQRAAELLEGAGYQQLINLRAGFSGQVDPESGMTLEQGWAGQGLPVATGADERGWEAVRGAGA